MSCAAKIGLCQRHDIPRTAGYIEGRQLVRIVDEKEPQIGGFGAAPGTGHSETLDLLVAMLNRRVHPVVPSRGSVGASGDLAPLAHLALPLVGEGECRFEARILDGSEALRAAGLEPVTLEPKES